MGRMRIVLGKRQVYAGLACLLVLIASTATALAAGNSGKTPTVKKISVLYALNARTGTLRPQKGKGAKYTLVLKGLDRDVTWFSDRPARRSGSLPVAGFAEAWKGFGFAADPPNAALTYTDKRGDQDRTVIVELSHPRLADGKLSFAARALDPQKIREPNLAGHSAVADRHPARSFDDASLFIDDTSGEVAGSCLLAPATRCEGMTIEDLNAVDQELQGASFSRSYIDLAHIENSNLEHAYFVETSFDSSTMTRSSLEEADLTEADLSGVELRGDDLKGAHISRADLTGADDRDINLEGTLVLDTNFIETNLEGLVASDAELAGDNFEDANLREADLRHANLMRVNFRGADLTDAETFEASVQYSDFCGAKMPDGTIGPCNGPINYMP
jgi:hypothetical protein